MLTVEPQIRVQDHPGNGDQVLTICTYCQERFWRDSGLLDVGHNCLDRILPDHLSPIRLEFKKIHEHAKTPTRKRISDAGYDIATIQSGIVEPNQIVNFDTGLIVAAPIGYYYSVDGRSSLWSKGIVPLRGIIDGGYCGPLCVALMNISSTAYTVHSGDRIAQLILHKVQAADFTEVKSFSPNYSIRGTAGFGSSGR